MAQFELYSMKNRIHERIRHTEFGKNVQFRKVLMHSRGLGFTKNYTARRPYGTYEFRFKFTGNLIYPNISDSQAVLLRGI